MTRARQPLDPALLEVLSSLRLDLEEPPGQAEWSALLERLSQMLEAQVLEEPSRASRDARGAMSPHEDAALGAQRVFEAFLSTMSHELRTPVAVILGCLELLGSSSVAGTERHGTVATARRAALDLIQTIDDILDYCRIEAGELGLVRRPFELEALLKDILARHQGQADARGLALEYRADTRLPRRVVGDAHRIEQILEVLLDNALKFTREGFVRLAVQVEASQGAQVSVRFTVTDTGPGIPRGALDQVFAPFRQLDASPSRRYGGIGLGLPLAQRLARAMGGQLDVSSAPLRGSVFSFAVELACVREQEPSPRRRRVRRRRTPHVLLAEDNEFNRTFIARSLELIGCRVRAVPDGRAALEALPGFDPDLVLLDMQMPEIDGLTAARKIRELREPFASVPIIALTANAQHAHRAQCEDAGMDELLAKPVSAESLRLLLERWVPLEERAPAGDSVGEGDSAPEDEPAPTTVRAPSGDEEAVGVSSPLTEPGEPEPRSRLGTELSEFFAEAAGILDLGRLEELVQQAGDVAILRELSAIFLEDMDLRLAGLSEAYGAGNEEEVRRLAHAVKGSSANFGAIEMAQYAERLELEPPSKAQKEDLCSLEQAFVEVRRVLESARLIEVDTRRGYAGG